MKYLLGVVQIFAMATALAFVVLLFLLQPDASKAPAATTAGTAATGGTVTTGGTAATGGTVVAATTAAAPAIDAAALFDDRCSSCHGRSGEGLTAPALSNGRVAAKFPDIEAQVAVVRDGRNGMPSFGDRISDEQIRAIVRYTRTL